MNLNLLYSLQEGVEDSQGKNQAGQQNSFLLSGSKGLQSEEGRVQPKKLASIDAD